MNTVCVGCLVDDVSLILRTLLPGTSLSMVAVKRTLNSSSSVVQFANSSSHASIIQVNLHEHKVAKVGVCARQHQSCNERQEVVCAQLESLEIECQGMEWECARLRKYEDSQHAA